MAGAFPIDEAQIVGLFMECVFYGARFLRVTTYELYRLTGPLRRDALIRHLPRHVRPVSQGAAVRPGARLRVQERAGRALGHGRGRAPDVHLRHLRW